MFWLFWVINKLIPFYDVQAVSELAKAHQLTAQVLEQGTKTWEKLVKWNCPFYEHKQPPMEDHTCGNVSYYVGESHYSYWDLCSDFEKSD